jgi:hypothetical protein
MYAITSLRKRRISQLETKFVNFIEELKGSKDWIELNKQRKTTYWRYVLSWLIGFGLFILGCGLLLFSTDEDLIMSGLGSIVMSFVMVIYLIRISRKLYSSNYKALVVPKIVTDAVQQFDSNTNSSSKKNNKCDYYADKHIGFNLLSSFPLFEKYDHKKNIYSGEDLFKGNLGDTDFQFSDILIKRNRDLIVVDQNVDITVFRGLVFIADFHKNFEGTTTIMTRQGKQYAHQTVVGSRMTTISHQFDQMFNIHTTDEITARYLLPVNMLERIIALRKLFPRKGIAICLHEGMLAISIHDFDFFEITKARKPRSSDIKQTYTEISAILEMIDVLNLNLRIWNKQ